MDRKTMCGRGASDVELRQWLCEICPVVTRTLRLPRPLEKAVDGALGVISVDTALGWVEMLGLGKAHEIRLMAQSIPDAAAKLSSPEGQEALRSWEASHGVGPVLRTLEQAVKTIVAFWKAGGHPRRAVIRALSSLGVSPVVPHAGEFREALAAVMGSGRGETVSLIEEYVAITVTNKVDKLESIDGLISRSVPFGAWVRSLWLRLRLKVQWIKGGMEVIPDSGHPLWRLSLILREMAGSTDRKAPDSKDSESIV